MQQPDNPSAPTTPPTDAPSAAHAGSDPSGATPSRASGSAPLYLPPDGFTRRVFNPLIAALTRMGISMWGSRVLEVPGRVTGETRRTPVNLLTVDGERYLVAPRGTTQWVRNVRAAGGCDLRVGRRVEAVTAVDVADDVKPAILRAYLRRWKWEVGQFFDGVDADSPDADLLAIAASRPVFLIRPR